LLSLPLACFPSPSLSLSLSLVLIWKRSLLLCVMTHSCVCRDSSKCTHTKTCLETFREDVLCFREDVLCFIGFFAAPRREQGSVISEVFCKVLRYRPAPPREQGLLQFLALSSCTMLHSGAACGFVKLRQRNGRRVHDAAALRHRFSPEVQLAIWLHSRFHRIFVFV